MFAQVQHYRSSNSASSSRNSSLSMMLLGTLAMATKCCKLTCDDGFVFVHLWKFQLHRSSFAKLSPRFLFLVLSLNFCMHNGMSTLQMGPQVSWVPSIDFLATNASFLTKRHLAHTLFSLLNVYEVVPHKTVPETTDVHRFRHLQNYRQHESFERPREAAISAHALTKITHLQLQF